MATRCLTVVKDFDDKEICVLYRQSDGYPEGHGKELEEFCARGIVVNGYQSKDQTDFNGVGCFAAQMVAHFKTGIGGFYLEPVGTRGLDEEFIYTVRCIKGKHPIVTVSRPSARS
jgi:hypothetical protein